MSAFDSELEGYETLVSELRANPPVAPERLRQRVLEGAPAPRRQRSRKRKLALVVVPVAVVLAVGAALVHGFVSSDRNQQRAEVAALSGGTVSGQQQTAKKFPGLYAPGTKSTQSSHLASKSYSLSQNSAALAPKALEAVPSVRRSVTIPKNRLVHAVASLQVGVKSSNLSDKTNEASQIVGSYGGYAQSVRYQATHQGDGEAILSLRVPVQNAQKAIAKLGNLGTLLSQSVSTQDLQAKLTQQNSGIGSLRRAIAVYENALQSTTLSASERVAIQIKLNNARHALARLRHARNGTLAAGANADISLLLTTRNHAIVAPHHGGSTRLGRLLGSAAHFLALEGIIVLYALIVLAPLILLGALGWWILRERRRREDRLLASA